MFRTEQDLNSGRGFMARVLIVGCGDIGLALARQLLTEGHHITAVKRRPLVIVTATNEMLLDAPIVGVAVTTTYPDPPPREFVELPWSRLRHPATRLSARSAARCDWLVELRPSQVTEIKGYVPTKTLLEILERVADLQR